MKCYAIVKDREITETIAAEDTEAARQKLAGNSYDTFLRSRLKKYFYCLLGMMIRQMNNLDKL